jgi:hypothetical protein
MAGKKDPSQSLYFYCSSLTVKQKNEFAYNKGNIIAKLIFLYSWSILLIVSIKTQKL